MVREIKALTCTYCGVEFFPNEGGVCSSCGKLFCAFDLRIDGASTAPYCTECRPDAAVKSRIDEPAATLLWDRRKLALKVRKLKG